MQFVTTLWSEVNNESNNIIILDACNQEEKEAEKETTKEVDTEAQPMVPIYLKTSNTSIPII